MRTTIMGGAAAVGLLGLSSTATAMPGDLFISEYVEGSSNNKALEFYNGTGAAIDLDADQYTIEFYFNGNAAPTQVHDLIGAVADGDTFVFTNPSAALQGIIDASDQVATNSIWFNGDDAVVLRKDNGGTVVDVFGQVGTDPGTQWGSGATGAQDATLRRNPGFCGDRTLDDPFDPAGEYDGFPQNTVDGLGAHAVDADCQISEPVVDCGMPTVRTIPEIQGTGATSPFVNDSVEVTGVVTAVFPLMQSQGSGAGGFYMQRVLETAPEGPGIAGASDGIFAFGAFGDVSEGDRVTVRGTVVEIDDSGSNGGSETAIELCEVGSTSAAAPVVPALLSLPVPPGSSNYLEGFEGMLVDIATVDNDRMRVAQNFFLGRYGQLTLSSPADNGSIDRVVQPTQVFEPCSLDWQARTDENGRRLLVLDDGQDQSDSGDNPDTVPYIGCTESGSPANRVIRAGDFASDLRGILDYGLISTPFSSNTFGYRLHPLDTSSVTFTAENLRPTTPPNPGASYEVVGFNVLNYFTTFQERGAFDAIELRRQTGKLVEAIGAMNADVLGLIELENNDLAIETLVEGGAFDGETVLGLNDVLGAGTYAFIQTGVTGTDAIKNGFLYKPSTTELVGAPAIIPSSVDGNDCFLNRNRPSIAQTFRQIATGEVFTVVVNHWKSKGSACGTPSDDLTCGAGNCNGTRAAMAQCVADWIDTDPTGSGDADFLLVGDLNSYSHEDPITVLTDAGLVDLVSQEIGVDVQQDFIFDGALGNLGYGIATQSMADQIASVAEWPINSDEAKVLDFEDFFNQVGCFELPPNEYRAADHDPLSLALDLGPDEPIAPGVPALPISGLVLTGLGLLAVGARQR